MKIGGNATLLQALGRLTMERPAAPSRAEAPSSAPRAEAGRAAAKAAFAMFAAAQAPNPVNHEAPTKPSVVAAPDRSERPLRRGSFIDLVV